MSLDSAITFLLGTASDRAAKYEERGGHPAARDLRRATSTIDVTVPQSPSEGDLRRPPRESGVIPGRSGSVAAVLDRYVR